MNGSFAPPAGMRDLLHPESAARRDLAERLGATFAAWGYDLVTTPPFEHAEVLERGLSDRDGRDLIRFVEPDSGEVALLRPDITPQVARVVATRLRDRPPPFRLRYEGTVMRRRRGRARRHRQIAQAGAECIGLGGPEADVEMITLAAQACEAAGLGTSSGPGISGTSRRGAFRIELRQVRVGLAALSAVPLHLRGAAETALADKDAARLSELLEGRIPPPALSLLVELPSLYGDLDVIGEARRLTRGDPSSTLAMDRLEVVADRAVADGLGSVLSVDLGALSGMSYYTGVSFAVLADGPGEPIGSGGRYDDLLGRFGLETPATGFAIDLDNLEWALGRAGRRPQASLPLRVVVAAGVRAERHPLAQRLRALGITAATVPADTDRVAFARCWGYDCVLEVDRAGVRAMRIHDGSDRVLDLTTPAQAQDLAAWARAGEGSSDRR